METLLRPMREEDRNPVVRMITEFYNLHQRLNNSHLRSQQTDRDSLRRLENWEGKGCEVLCIWCEQGLAGFLTLRYGGQNAACLEKIYVLPEFRKRGTESMALEQLDEMMREKRVMALFVDVIPRNEEALRFYLEHGFDHLNLLQLRKNYDPSLNRKEEIEVLGHAMKRY
jgi:GNAT superfamily N-acetyltransferase